MAEGEGGGRLYRAETPINGAQFQANLNGARCSKLLKSTSVP